MGREQVDEIRRTLLEVGRALDAVGDERDAARYEAATQRGLIRGYRDEQVKYQGRVHALETAVRSIKDQLGKPEPLRKVTTRNRETLIRWAAVIGFVVVVVGAWATIDSIFTAGAEAEHTEETP